MVKIWQPSQHPAAILIEYRARAAAICMRILMECAVSCSATFLGNWGFAPTEVNIHMEWRTLHGDVEMPPTEAVTVIADFEY